MIKTKLNPTSSVRLPDHVKPEHYWLSLVPDFKKFTFAGEETITLVLTKPESQIKLHAKELTVNRASITNGNQQWVLKISYDPGQELLILDTGENLPQGTYNLDLAFSGILNDKMRGFYRSEFKLKGKTEYIAVTQFEPTDARRAFPCFDEPAQKATFTAELVVPPGMTAISNTTIVNKTRLKSGASRLQFAPTPVMSSYLLAFVIGKFEFIEDLTEDGVTVRVFVTPGKKKQAEFALDTAKRVLEFFNRYFKVKYPLSTMDMIAIPDFAAGAMENWGAVTYRETAILVDQKNTSTLAKQWVGLVIAHELAHQWFGNLVTMEWWTHLWLNEGFATYISYLAIDEIYPEWNMWSQFANADLGPALELDSLQNTHPIQVPVNNPNEINEIFDEVSYAKGASVLRMLADYLGPVKFRDGLRHYLKKHQYGNAATEDLWRSLDIANGSSGRRAVAKLMDSWTSEPGYPLISVAQQGNRLKLSQRRFFADPRQKPAAKPVWSVPISIGDQKVKAKLLLAKKSALVPKPHSKYAKLNLGETGVFRTRYPRPMLRQFQPFIEDLSMPTADRLGILRDSIALARSGQMSTDQVLELLYSYRNEDKYTVWVEVSSAIAQILRVFRDEKFYPELEQFARELFIPIARKVGWEIQPDESSSQQLLRTLVLYRAGRYGDKETITKARELFNASFKKGAAIPADLRTVVYYITAENGGAAEFSQLLARHKEEQLQEEKNRLARALAFFQSELLLNKFFKFILSDEIRPQDLPLLLIQAWNNQMVRGPKSELVWNFITKNWKHIVKQFGEGGHLLVRFIEPASSFTTELQAKTVASFFKTHPAPGAERTIKQTIEEIRIQHLWRKRDKANVAKFLLNRRIEE